MHHHDFAAAFRSLRRSPGFVAIAVFSLGLAIGLYTTTHALIDAIRHPYDPYVDSGQLYTISWAVVGRDQPGLRREMYLALRERRDLFAGLVPWTGADATFEAGAHLVTGRAITADPRIFRVLGVQPVVGRVFDPAGDDPTDNGAAVISYQLWQEDFAENRDLAALQLAFGGRSYRVVGVMGPSVQFPEDADVWLPMPASVARAAPRGLRMEALVRLRPDDAEARVESELHALALSFTSEHRGEHAMFGYRLQSIRRTAHWGSEIPGLTYMVAFLILLIACLNLANLLLARGLGRRREMAVRLALGAGRRAIARYVLVECGIIVALGGAWGILASMWGVSLAQSRLPVNVTQLGFVAPRLSWGVVAFGFAVTAATVLAAGLIPAIRASRANVSDAIKDGGAGSTGRSSTLYRWVVMAEIAVALIITAGAAASLRLLAHSERAPFTFGAGDRLTTSVRPSDSTCDRHDVRSRFAEDLITRARSVPGVRYAAALTTVIPPHDLVTSDHEPNPIQVVTGGYLTEIGYSLVTADYFRVNDFPIAAGRDFDAADAGGRGAAIVSGEMATRLWGHQSPVGRLLKLGPSTSGAPWIPVVGVSGDRYQPGPDSILAARAPDLAVVGLVGCRAAAVSVRTRNRDPRAPLALYHALRTGAPAALVTEVRSDKADHDAGLRSQRLATLLFTAFAIFALVLSSVGVFAILTFVVSQRTREFAMRRALGADLPEVRRLIGKQAVELVLAGTAMGGVVALSLGYLISGFIFKVGVADPVGFALAELVIIAASLAACLGPIRQAMRADPVDLLRAT
jgi:putative ABC transport system permease protein